jgi:hypothetical protein
VTEIAPEPAKPVFHASEDDVEPELTHSSRYDMMGFRAEVRSNVAEAIAAVDRLNAFFLVGCDTEPQAVYEVVDHGEGIWELTFQSEELCFRPSLQRAVGHVEWHMCEQAIAGLKHLLHVHGAAVAGPNASVLLPGTSGIGKTTFAIAIALLGKERGVRLLSDDVVFLHPDTWRPESFPRAFHIHDDALPRLEPLGLKWAPEDHFGAHLCSTVLGQEWDRTPGPPLRHVVFPRLDPDGPISLDPISEAEATVELMRYSKNLRSFPRFGLDMIPRLLSQVRCYVLRRNDDLAAAADAVMDLATRG